MVSLSDVVGFSGVRTGNAEAVDVDIYNLAMIYESGIWLKWLVGHISYVKRVGEKAGLTVNSIIMGGVAYRWRYRWGKPSVEKMQSFLCDSFNSILFKDIIVINGLIQ